MGCLILIVTSGLIRPASETGVLVTQDGRNMRARINVPHLLT